MAACQVCWLIMTRETLDPMHHINSGSSKCCLTFAGWMWRSSSTAFTTVSAPDRHGWSEALQAVGEAAAHLSKHRLRRTSNNGAQVRVEMDISVTAWPVQTHAVTRTCAHAHCRERPLEIWPPPSQHQCRHVNSNKHTGPFVSVPYFACNPERIRHIHLFDRRWIYERDPARAAHGSKFYGLDSWLLE